MLAITTKKKGWGLAPDYIGELIPENY